MKLLKKIIYKGIIKTKTGLHIGGTNSAMGIGGPDSLVIRNPIDNRPFIPGSSIKGKMRSLLEVLHGTIGDQNMGVVKNGPSQDKNAKSVKLFGTASNAYQRPSRLQVRDAHLTRKWQDEKEFGETDLPYTESKTEVVIDRITSAAMPRSIERIPAGAEFELNFVLNIFEDDNETELMNSLDTAIKLLEDDYLGGNGSRGYGQVSIEIKEIEEKTAETYKDQATKLVNKGGDGKV